MVPVSILRDTGASCSEILKDSVPFLKKTCTGENSVIRSTGGSVTVPLCRLYLNSDLHSGPVIVAVKETLSISGVSFHMCLILLYVLNLCMRTSC